MSVMTSDLDKLLSDFDRRIYRVEQQMTSPAVMGMDPNPTFETITVGDTGFVLITEESNPPLNLSVTVGAHYEMIFADVDWDPSTSGNETTYLVEWARKIGPSVYDFPNSAVTGGANYRITPLEPLTNYGVRVRSVNRIGKFSTVLPATGYYDFTTGKDSTVPAQVTGLTAGLGLTSIVAKWNTNSEIDVALGVGWYEVQVATDTLFTNIIRSTRTTAQIVGFNDITQIGSPTYWVRVAAVDSSGNQGPWATMANATTGTVVDAVTANEINGVKIIAGTVQGDRIIANTLDANRITSSSVTAANIYLAGGQLVAGVTSPSTSAVILNSQGLRMYTGGTLMMTLDAATGGITMTGPIFTGGSITSASISAGSITGATITGGTITGVTITGGTIQTATSGVRLVISGGSEITMYDGAGYVSAIRTFGGAGGGLDFQAGNGGATMRLLSGGYPPEFTVLATGINLNARTEDIQMFFGGASNNTTRVHFAQLTDAYVQFDMGRSHDNNGHSEFSLGPYTCIKGMRTFTEIQVRDLGDTAYAAIRASSFPLGSKIEFKKNIAPADSALSLVCTTPVHNYELKKGGHPGERYVGLMYEEAPEILRSGEDGLNVTSMIGMLWKAMQELADLVEAAA